MPHFKATVLYIKKYRRKNLLHASEGALMFISNSLLPCNHGNVMRQGLA